MNSIVEFLRNWFGYTRRERRSTFILLIIILAVIGVRFVVPGRNMSIEEIPLNFAVAVYDTSVISKNNSVAGFREKKEKYRKRTTLMDLNTSDSASLESLPGIGPVLSSRIIKYRNLIGGYISVSQLKEVYGLPEETYERISSMLFADTMNISKIRINVADYKEMIRHPYFKREEVPGILKYRDLKGNIDSVGEMIENRLISPETGKRISSYLDFR
jgi:DNA uptake protein ComE-like DNA-binding protein